MVRLEFEKKVTKDKAKVTYMAEGKMVLTIAFITSVGKKVSPRLVVRGNEEYHRKCATFHHDWNIDKDEKLFVHGFESLKKYILSITILPYPMGQVLRATFGHIS